MNPNFIWEAVTVLLIGYCLQRIIGKKTAGEMTGLEIITLLSMASMIGHAVRGDGLLRTIITLCIFVTLLLTIQFLAIKFNRIEKWVMGEATLVIKNGQILTANLKKLRMSVDQLEAKLREKGIISFTDIKTATIEMSGEIGYELMNHAKPVTLGDLDKIVAQLLQQQQPQQPKQKDNLFDEVVRDGHHKYIPSELV
ncbi:DUF421 domain-containing protein [Paenibacillus lycopersici]|uniref:DUF421 domain-containing protein n=1 Tax=Paenibacillus lycopersici TaxID=2704462 RepID=A0A6C0FZA9_9BACL|nr:YetF domain-containing protein [Paenibacillus lycopersici]QHT61412.1 DUF421 domain-containing protein [Paenibacillus lycopersici]